MKYYVEKNTTINTTKDKVKPLIEDFNQWGKWSPWNIIEPECPMEIKGIPGKPDQSMSWDGSIIGSGVNTLEKIDDSGYHYDLQFIKPFKSKAKTSLLLSEENGTTKVTWTMDSSMPFFMFFMVMMMKNWIGMDYERGLRMLKELAEKGEIKASTENNGIVDKKGFSYVGIQRTVGIDMLGPKMQEDFNKIIDDIVKKYGKSAKEWITVYPKFDMKNMSMTYIAAVSDENLKDVDLGSEYVHGSIKESKVLEIKHHGSYDFLGNAWSMGMMYTRAKKLKSNGFPFEQYWNSPLETKSEDLETSIFFPIKDR